MRLTSTRWPISRSDHRAARYPIGLDHEGLDQKREPDRHGDDHHELDQRLATALVLFVIAAVDAGRRGDPQIQT